MKLGDQQLARQQGTVFGARVRGELGAHWRHRLRQGLREDAPRSGITELGQNRCCRAGGWHLEVHAAPDSHGAGWVERTTNLACVVGDPDTAIPAIRKTVLSSRTHHGVVRRWLRGRIVRHELSFRLHSGIDVASGVVQPHH